MVAELVGQPVGQSVRPRVELDETTLVARAQDGDLESFERLVDLYSGQLFRLALRMLGDRGEAEDVVQEVFVQVWRRLPALAEPAAFPKWVYQIATRLTLNVLRTRQRRPAAATDPDDLPGMGSRATPVGRGDPADATTQHAMAAALEHKIAQLPDDQRFCWVLHAYHRRTYAEIALIVGATESTVRGRIARARRQLAEGMTAWR